MVHDTASARTHTVVAVKTNNERRTRPRFAMSASGRNSNVFKIDKFFIGSIQQLQIDLGCPIESYFVPLSATTPFLSFIGAFPQSRDGVARPGATLISARQQDAAGIRPAFPVVEYNRLLGYSLHAAASSRQGQLVCDVRNSVVD